MAGETVLIVGGDVVRKRFVRIMAGDAGDASVSASPALAVFETIGGEANVEDADFEEMTGDDVLPSAMACAAKIYGVDAGELSGVENQTRAALFGFGASCRDVLCAGAVAGFAGDAEKRGAGIKLIFCRGSGGVTAEAEAHFVGRDETAHGSGESCRDRARLAGSDV